MVCWVKLMYNTAYMNTIQSIQWEAEFLKIRNIHVSIEPYCTTRATVSVTETVMVSVI